MSVIGGAASALSDLASAGGPPGGATLPRPNINHSSTPALVEALRHAIMCGDENQARQMAAQLSRQRARLHIQLDVVSPSSALDQEVRTKVYIEDKTDSGGFMWMNLKPSMTIRDLKRKMLLEYGFPTEVQNWVIGKRIGKDDETLFRLNVRTAGEIIYLYLVSAKSVNLTRQLYRDRFNGHLWPDEEELEEYEAHVHQVAAGAGGGGDVGGPSRGPARRLQTELRDIRPHTVQTGGEGSPGGADLHAGAPSQRGAQFTSSHATQLPPQSPTTQPQKVGWDCPKCTFLNPPTRPGCKMCGEARPDDYQIPIDYEMTPEEEERIQREMQLDDMVQQQEFEERLMNQERLREIDNVDLVPNQEEFTCLICYDTFSPGEGVLLRECLHMFCRECLSGQVEYSEEATIKCPYQDDSYNCAATLQDREVRALVSDSVYAKYLKRSLMTAESTMEHSYHCKSPDCPGFCVYEDNVNFFQCPVCNQRNCLTCKAIHVGMNCQQYQADLEIRAVADEDARNTQLTLQRMIDEGNAMRCPKCRIIVQKKDGCDWVQCTMCKTEICWVTKGPRWGPAGAGDISGGCGCRVDGNRCHIECQNCH